MADVTTFPWAQVIAILLGNGLVTYMLTWRREARRDAASKDRDARYIALRITAILERFAYECADLISTNDGANPYDEQSPGGTTKLPSLREYPSDADWKALDPSLASRALSLPTEIEVSRGYISFWWDGPGDQDAMLCETSEQAGKCGFRAWSLALDLRRKYNLPDSHLLEVSWAWVEQLRTNHEQSMARLAKRKAAA